MTPAFKSTSATKGLANISSLAIASVLLVGCASTGNVTPQYIPPSNYDSYNCNSLTQEYNRVNNYIQQTQSQRSTFSTTGVGVGISAGRWGVSPNINIGLGKSSNTQARDAKLSRLYGERDALIQSARLKNCAFAQGLKVYGE